MTNQQNTKPLSTMALKAMKPSNKVLVDTGENRGLRVRCVEVVQHVLALG